LGTSTSRTQLAGYRTPAYLTDFARRMGTLSPRAQLTCGGGSPGLRRRIGLYLLFQHGAPSARLGTANAGLQAMLDPALPAPATVPAWPVPAGGGRYRAPARYRLKVRVPRPSWSKPPLFGP
jgi:hypothetical protein